MTGKNGPGRNGKISARPATDLPTLKSLKPEHLFMLCEWNSGEGPSEASSPTEWGSGDPTPDIFKKTRLQMVHSEQFWSFIPEKKLFYFFFIRSNYVFSGAVGSYAATPDRNTEDKKVHPPPHRNLSGRPSPWLLLACPCHSGSGS